MIVLTINGTCDRCGSTATFRRTSTDQVAGFRCTCGCHK